MIEPCGASLAYPCPRNAEYLVVCHLLDQWNWEQALCRRHVLHELQQRGTRRIRPHPGIAPRFPLPQRER